MLMLVIPADTFVSIFSELQPHLAFLDYLWPFGTTTTSTLFLHNVTRGQSQLLFLRLIPARRLTHGDSQLVPEGLHEVLEHGIPQEFRLAKGEVGATRTLVPKVVKGRTGPREHESRLRDALVEGFWGWKVIAWSLRSVPLPILVEYMSAVHHQLIPGLSPLLTSMSHVVRLRRVEWRLGAAVPIPLLPRLQAIASSVPCSLDIPMIYPSSIIVVVVLVHSTGDIIDRKLIIAIWTCRAGSYDRI